MGKARIIFLNFIYIVLLVEVALNTGKIDSHSYYQSNMAIENSIDAILSRHEDVKKYYSDYLGRLQPQDRDYIVVAKIKKFCEDEDVMMRQFKDIKEKLITTSGGYNKKQEISSPTDKRSVGKILIGNNFLENVDDVISQIYTDLGYSYNKSNNILPHSVNLNAEDVNKKDNFVGIENKSKGGVQNKNNINSQNIKNNIDSQKNTKNNINNAKLNTHDNNGIVNKHDNKVNKNIGSGEEEDDDFDAEDEVDNNDNNEGVVLKEETVNKDKDKSILSNDNGAVGGKVDSNVVEQNNAVVVSRTLEFKKLTLVESLLKLSQKQLHILTNNESLLQDLISHVSGTKNSLDSFDIIVTPKHNTVVPGEDFEADICLVANNSFVNPKYKINNKDIDVIDGVGKVKIPSPKNIVFDNSGISRQSFNVQVVQYDPYTNKDIIVNKEVKYEITKKSNIDGQYATMESLYRHCGNKYKVRNLAPEINSDISFKFKGGEYKVLNSNQDEYELLLIPNDDVCYLQVYNKSREIETFKFNVVDVKIPTVLVALNGKIYGNGDVIQLPQMRDAQVIVSADEYFKNHFKDESEYKVKHFNIIFCSDKNIVKQESVNGAQYNFGNDSKLTDINKIIIRIDDVVRVNCNNVEVPVLKNGSYFDRSFNVVSNKSNDDEEED